MRPEERIAAWLWDMSEAIRRLQRHLEGHSYPDFIRNELLMDAVLRTLTVLGEAAARVDQAYQDAHPEIPWKSIVGLRNVVTHQYNQIEYLAVWDAATIEAPALLVHPRGHGPARHRAETGRR